MGASQSHQAASSHLVPSVQTQKHRHLVALVEHKIAPSCSDEEKASLYNLVSSTDQAQSKWAHPERLGQAELYSSLEKVLNELRAFTPYSVPFSTRVSRKDVPDYYEGTIKPLRFVRPIYHSHSYKTADGFGHHVKETKGLCVQ
jgi:inactivated superfamily I helicase